MPLIPDLKEFIELLNSHNVRYVIVGGWAFNFYCNPRSTGDFDFFVSNDLENQQRLREVLIAFGFGDALPPLEEELLPGKRVLMLGRQPNRIDLLAHIDGVLFEEAWGEKERGMLDDVSVYYLSKRLLIKNKKAAKRAKDAADVEALEELC